jgi:16S rRNA processing protein RimM
MTGTNMVNNVSSEQDKLIVVGAVKGAHGVRGDVRVKSFTSDPDAVFDYGPLLDKAGVAIVTVQSARAAKDHFIVRAKETRTKEEWDALKGTLLHVPRAALPAVEEDEFYISDMVGLEVYAGGDTVVGKVEAIQNFGAGDLVEIKPLRGGKSILVPFSLADIPTVDITAGRLIVPAFDEWLAAEDEIKDEI